MENSTKILIGAGIVVAIGAIVYYRMKDSKMVGKDETCFNLPKDVDPDTFGPYYWDAFHKLASQVPCGACRGFAEKFITYFHDLVNLKTLKPVYDKDNFYYFNNAIAKLNSGADFKNAFSL